MPYAYARWFARISPHSVSIETSRFRNLSRGQYIPLVDNFDACVLCLAEGELKLGDEFLERTGPLLKRNGQLFVFTINGRADDFEGFGPSVAYHAARFSNLKLWVSETKFVRASNLRWKLRQRSAQLAHAVARHPLFYFPVAAIAGGFIGLISFTCNRVALRARSAPGRRGGCSSVLMMMRPSGNQSSMPLPHFAPDEKLLTYPVASDVDREFPQRFGSFGFAPSATADNVIQSQYGNEIDDRDTKQGNTKAIEEPKTGRRRRANVDRLSVIAARYKFAANVLAGHHDVCELGRSHPHGLRLVLQQVKKLYIYDSDEAFIEQSRHDNPDVPTLTFGIHDLVLERLPTSHNSIYSFDVLERTAPEHEDDFILHLRDSLSRSCDIALIGCPSPDHGEGNLSKSATQRIYTRTGPELRELMHQGFDTVIPFSMSGEVVEAGISPRAQYYLAVCCSKKYR